MSHIPLLLSVFLIIANSFNVRTHMRVQQTKQLDPYIQRESIEPNSEYQQFQTSHQRWWFWGRHYELVQNDDEATIENYVMRDYPDSEQFVRFDKKRKGENLQSQDVQRKWKDSQLRNLNQVSDEQNKF